MLPDNTIQSLSDLKEALLAEECEHPDGCLIGEGIAVLLPVEQLDPTLLCVDCRTWYYAELLYRLAMRRLAN